MQWRQEEHDRLFHSDIYALSKHHRLSHLVLHLAKYVGKDRKLAREEEFDKRVTNALDALIVLMSIFNCLNVVIDQIPADKHHPDGHGGWDYDDTVINTGEMAKAVEAIDHLEALDYKAVLIKHGTFLISDWKSQWDFCTRHTTMFVVKSIEEMMFDRLVEIEKKNIHYDSIVEQNPTISRQYDLFRQ